MSAHAGLIAGGRVSAPVLTRDATIESIGRLMGGSPAAEPTAPKLKLVA